MKALLIVSLALAVFGGPAFAGQSSDHVPRSTIACSSVYGAPFVGCQKPAVPTAKTVSKMYKMLHPKPVNGRGGRNLPRHDHSNL